MNAEIVDGVQIDVCPTCAGIWFGSDELRTMLGNSQTAIQDVEKAVPSVEQRHVGASALLCPDDRVGLELYHYLYTSAAVLHTCPTCGGFFIESEELPKMELALVDAHKPSDGGAEAIAQFTAEHERTMLRQQQVRGMFTTLSQFSPGWFI